LIPATFKILYPFATNIGATPFFSLEEFMSSVFSLMVITGIMFLLPIFMVLLSFLGIVKPDFWISKLRFAALFFLIFTAIITPDGTGITMLILFFPLIGLYLIGCLLTGRFKKRNMDKYMENRVELEENNQQ
jgi:sec-independent protein translocase protein TatC